MSIASSILKREMRGMRSLSFGSDNYWTDYRLSHRSVGTSGAFNWKEEHGVLLAVGSRDAYALNIVSLEKAPESSGVWTSWMPWKRDAEASHSRGICEPHLLAVEPNAHSNWINDIMFSRDDSELLSASDDGAVIVYDVQRGKQKTALPIPGRLMARSLSVAALEKDLVFVAADRVVFAWDRRTKASGQSLMGHSGRVSDVECSRDARLLWSTALDGTLRTWDRRKEMCIASLGNRSTPLASVCLDKYESRLLVSSEKGPVYLFDLIDSECELNGPNISAVPQTKVFTGHSNRHYLKRARFSPCGNFVINGSDDKRAYVWNIRSGQQHIFEVPQLRSPSLVDALFSNQSRLPLVALAAEEGIFMWSPSLAPKTQTQAPTTDATTAVPAATATDTAYEIKFSVEGTPVDDDFVEVNETIEDEEEEEEEFEDELVDMLRSEPGVCSYDKGYGIMHVFVCRTCSLSSDPPVSAGMCFECRVHCHAEHDTVSIGKKRNFRCDCGTDAYPGVPCLLRGGKTTNDKNVYTHNFGLLYCYCNQPDDGALMLQCLECFEWHHHSCIGIPNQETTTEGLDFLCEPCIRSTYAFLSDYPADDLNTRQAGAASAPQSGGTLGYRAVRGRFLPPDWTDLVRPEHAQLVARLRDEQQQQQPVPQASNARAPVAPIPAAAASSAIANAMASIPEAAVATGPQPVFEPRTKAELDAEAKRLIQSGDRAGAAQLVMRAMLSNTIFALASSRRRTVTVQDVTRAAEEMQAASGSTAIVANRQLPDTEAIITQPALTSTVTSVPALASTSRTTPLAAPTSPSVHTLTSAAEVPAAATIPETRAPHGEKHERATEVLGDELNKDSTDTRGDGAQEETERAAKQARTKDEQRSPAPTAAVVPILAKVPQANGEEAPLEVNVTNGGTVQQSTEDNQASALLTGESVHEESAAVDEEGVDAMASEPTLQSVQTKETDAIKEVVEMTDVKAAPLLENGNLPEQEDVAMQAADQATVGEALETLSVFTVAAAEAAVPASLDAVVDVVISATTAEVGSVEALLDANEAVADDMERRLAEIVQQGDTG